MKKKIISITAIISGLVGIISLASCKGNETPSSSNTPVVEPSTSTNTATSGASASSTQQAISQHNWDTEWDHDNTNHWHNCLDDDCDLVKNIAPHTFDSNDECTVCGYKKEVAPAVDVDSIKEVLLYDHIQSSKRETKLLQKVFKLNDQFNTTNLALKVKKNIDRVETTELLSLNDVQISAPDMTTAGIKEVKITYGSKEVSYNITVLDLANVNKEHAVVNVNQTATPSVSGNTVTVNTINDAVMVFKLLGTSANADKVINVSEGKYIEKVEFDIPNIRLSGADTDASKTVIEYNLFAEIAIPNSLTTGYSTDGGASVSIREAAQGFSARNITFQNYWNTNARYNESKIIADEIKVDKTKSGQTQAVACLVQADKAVFDNVRFSGYHDTLYSQVGRHIYNNCYIEGRTDYIFGTTATSYFKGCTIKTIGANDSKNGGYVAATMGSDNNGSDNSLIEYGYIFDDCTFTADENVQDGTVSLGRFWKDNMHMAVINSTISKAYSLTPFGYTGDQKNTRYTKMSSASTVTASQLIEYNNDGEGALTETTPGTIDNLCTIVSQTEADKYNDYSVIFAKQNHNLTYPKAWDGSIGSLVPVTYTFETLAERTMSNSEEGGDSLLDGAFTVKGKYRIEHAKNLMQVDLGTVIEFNLSGTLTVKWFGSNYGCADNATITYKNGKATITFDDLAGQNGIYFSGFELDRSEPGVHEHVYGEWQYTVPTLEATGIAYRACQDCENDPATKQEVTLPMLTDDRYTVVSTVPATTTAKGEGTYSITIDGVTYSFTGETPMLEEGQHVHVYQTNWTITAPTDTETGSAVKECIAEGCTNPVDKIEVELPVLTDSNYEITNNTATYDAAGTATYTITVDENVVSFTAATPQLEIKAITTSQTYTFSNGGRTNGDLEPSTEYFKMSGAVVNGNYLKFTGDSTITFTAKKGAVITISGIYSDWATAVNINTVDVEGVVADGHATVTYTVTNDGDITIKAKEGTQGSLKSIEVLSLKQITKNYNYTYSTNKMNNDEYLNFVNCEDSQNKQIVLKSSKNSEIKLNVVAGSVINIHSTYIKFADHWGGLNIEGTNYDTNDISHTVINTGVLILKTSTTEGVTQCAIDSISVIAPVELQTISTAGKIAFGDTNNATYQTYIDNSQLECTATVTKNGTKDSSVLNGKLKFKVAAGAKIDIYGNYKVNYQIGSETISGLTSEIGANKIINFTEETTVEIICSTNNYFYWIDITFPED